MQSRVKQEGNRREYLCTTFGKRKDKNFNATGKRECSICYFDLYLSAAHCPCSADRYSCLNHAKRLCSSCTWTEKIFLYQLEISELNILVEALEGKLSAVYRWAREDLNLGLHYYIPKEKSCTKDRGKNERTFQDAGTSYGNGLATAFSLKAEVKARLRQSQYLNKQKSKEKTISTPSLPSVTQDDTSLLLREMMPDLNDVGKGRILSTSSSSHHEREETISELRRPLEREVALSELRRTPEREVISELLKDISRKHHLKSTSEGQPMSHPASKKRKKK